MDFFELVVLLFFIVIPLLQGFLRRGKGDESGPVEGTPVPGESRQEADPLPDGAGPSGPAAAHTADEGWAVDWGEWPGEHVAAEPELLPEAVRVSAPVVSMEDVNVDRAAEHRRLHATLSRPTRTEPTREARVIRLLEGSGDLRRAIILGEVLGPPPALRDLPPS